MRRMLGMRELKAQDLHGLTPDAVKALATQMLEHIQSQASELERRQQLIEHKDRDIAWRDAKLEEVNFELARLKRWKIGAKTEVMSAEQHRLFEEKLAEDEASSQAQLERLREEAAAQAVVKPKAPPAHLKRVERRHEPEDTTCPTPDCSAPMTRIGEDVSERLDSDPALRAHL